MDSPIENCLSPLKSHKKSHKLQDNPDDWCVCSLNAETTQHFLLKYPGYNEHRHLLLQTLNPILLANDINHRNDCELVRLLLSAHEKLKLLFIILPRLDILTWLLWKKVTFSPPCSGSATFFPPCSGSTTFSPQCSGSTTFSPQCSGSTTFFPLFYWVSWRNVTKRQ